MKLSEELKHWGYHSDISDEGKRHHLEMAATASKLETVANVMSSDDAVFIADVLTTATNTHGVNQTFNNDPYYLTKLAKDLVGALTDLEKAQDEPTR